MRLTIIWKNMLFGNSKLVLTHGAKISGNRNIVDSHKNSSMLGA